MDLTWVYFFVLCLQYYTVGCCYNAVNVLENPHKRHLIARPLGRGMGCLLWLQTLDLNAALVTAVMYPISGYWTAL